jgi:signal transduction histidine kinase
LRNSGRLERHRITVETTPAWVNGDAVRLSQIVDNLLQNAIKYTPADGQIEVQTLREGDAAVLRVRDTGVGIAADLLPHVFELFVQGTRSLDRSEGGLGVGLTLSHRPCRRTEVASLRQAMGLRNCTITVSLPRVEPSQQQTGTSGGAAEISTDPTHPDHRRRADGLSRSACSDKRRT